MNSAPTLTDRLAGYRPTLDAAIAAHTRDLDFTRSEPHPPEGTVIDHFDGRRRSRVGSRIVIGAAAAVVVGGLTVITFTRPDGDTVPAGPDTAVGATGSAPGVTVDTVAGTTPVDTVLGGGASLPCPASVGDPLVPAGTLYLGGPANDQNLALPGSIFALPDDVPAVDVAVRAIGLAVIGYDCNITTSALADGHVIVNIDPPASSTRVTLDVQLVETDNAVAVTAITGLRSFETNVVDGVATLTFLGDLPPNSARTQVRFKKGDDVWELSAGSVSGSPIALSVPAGETDRFPDEPVDWVLFTTLDAQDLLVDAGGTTI